MNKLIKSDQALVYVTNVYTHDSFYNYIVYKSTPNNRRTYQYKERVKRTIQVERTLYLRLHKRHCKSEKDRKRVLKLEIDMFILIRFIKYEIVHRSPKRNFILYVSHK